MTVTVTRRTFAKLKEKYFNYRNYKTFSTEAKNKNLLFPEMLGDEKNLHPGGRKFIFLIDFP